MWRQILVLYLQEGDGKPEAPCFWLLQTSFLFSETPRGWCIKIGERHENVQNRQEEGVKGQIPQLRVRTPSHSAEVTHRLSDVRAAVRAPQDDDCGSEGHAPSATRQVHSQMEIMSTPSHDRKLPFTSKCCKMQLFSHVDLQIQVFSNGGRCSKSVNSTMKDLSDGICHHKPLVSVFLFLLEGLFVSLEAQMAPNQSVSLTFLNSTSRLSNFSHLVSSLDVLWLSSCPNRRQRGRSVKHLSMWRTKETRSLLQNLSLENTLGQVGVYLLLQRSKTNHREASASQNPSLSVKQNIQNNQQHSIN